MRALLISLFLTLSFSAIAQDGPPKLRTVLLNGQVITFGIRGEYAVVDGDIVLGKVADIEAAAQAEAAGSKDDAKLKQAIVALNAQGQPPLWPNRTLYYAIDSSVPAANRVRIATAIDHWNTRTPLRILPRVAETDYVTFVSEPGSCASSAGRIGGEQFIWLDDTGCDTGSIIHEIGHAFGLLHEQSRADRNAWLTLLYENIDTVYYSQFNQFRASRDVGFYDYGSIMHYPSVAFSLENKIVEETVPPGIPIGQRSRLSAGDIDHISRVYGVSPAATTITTVPEGLAFFADGQRYTSPRTFDWTPGSVHTIGVEPLQTFPTSRYHFVRWTDSGDTQHEFIANPGQTVVQAQFQARYLVGAEVASGEGSVKIEPASPDGYYPLGTEVRFTAIPEQGRRFLNWAATPNVLAGYGIGLGAQSFALEIGGTFLARANFTDQPVTTITSSPPGQVVVVDNISVRTPANFAWEPGSQHVLNIRTPLYSPTASTRYRWAGWENDDINGRRIVTATDESQTFRARFVQQHYLSIARLGSGSFTWNPAQDSNYIDAGLTVQLGAIPLSGQTLQYWLGDLTGTGLTKDLVMSRPRSVVAVLGAPLPFRMYNAASYMINPAFELPFATVAPLEMVTLFGTNVGPATPTPGQLDDQGRLATGSGNTRVLFNGIPAPILYTSSTQTTVIVPKEVATRVTTTVALERNGQILGQANFSVTPTLPGIFTVNSLGTGPIIALNEDGTRNAADNPAAPGSYITFVATGAGLMSGDPANGEIMGAANLSGPLGGAYARLGKEPMELYYAGSAPGQVNGIVQVNARIPWAMQPGEWPIRVIFGGAASPPGTTLFVH